MSFPSKEQRQVIEHSGRPLIVVAAPGTGKTSTIVARMERLLKENPNRDVSFITFTRTSRRDTERKINDSVGRQALQEAKFYFPRVSTLHTYAKSIVHKYSTRIGRHSNFSILIDDRGERDLVISEVIDDLSINIDLSILKRELSRYRNTGNWSDDCPIPNGKQKEVLDRFCALLQFYNTFDIEGLVPAACSVLSDGPADLPSVFLQIDEYQDLNPMDQSLVALASQTKSSQVVVVGDDAQSIYGFRDANPKGIRDLWTSDKWEHKHFPDCYRLPPHILRAAQALISKREYLGGEVNLPKDDGKRILTLQCTKSDLQIDAVARLIGTIMKLQKRPDGLPLTKKDFMILCPTLAFVNKVARDLYERFGISTKQREKRSIPDDHWRLLLVLRMLNSQDSLALRQWLEIIGIDPADIRRHRMDALKSDKSLFAFCSRLSSPAIKEVFTHLSRLRSSIDDIDRFRKELHSFPFLLVEDTLFPEVGITINEVTKQPASVGTVIRSIHEMFGLLDREFDIPDDDKVLVSTMYSAKGLEAKVVFIMWLNSTFLPAPDRDQEEERRVFYVAMTRAKQDTIFTFHEKYDGARLLRDEAMSPFLKGIVDHLIIKRVRKDDLK
jgi:DNA helicase-2/ATP-dependent DNA helicase PcrA